VTVDQYLSDPTLSARYVEMLNAIGAQLQGFMTKSHNHAVVKPFLVNLMGSNIDYEKLRDSVSIFYDALVRQRKVTPEITLLAQHLGVQLYTPPPPPPSSALAQHVQRPSLSEQTIQILMDDGRFTREVVMSALNQTNNDVAAAIDLLNLPPTQVVQEAYPVTSDLKNPETFVNNYVRTNHIELLPQPVYAPDQRRNLNAFPGFDRWKVIQTVGDGNCLTHAFLQCLSPTYGKIKDGGGYKNKYNVALEFRKVFSQTSDLARDKNTYSDGNYTGYLTDREITDYSRLFNLITVVFENQFGQTLINASNFSINSTPTDNVLFIHGDGGHYSSVMLPTGQFTMTLAEARQIPGLRQSLTI